MGRPSGTGSRPGTEPSLASLRAESGVAAARPHLFRGFAWGPKLRRGEVRTKSRRGTSVSRSMSGVGRMDQAPATGDREDGQPVPRRPSGRPRKAARTSNEPGATSVPAPAPRQLPPAIHGFVGRAEHLAELTRMLDGHIDRSGTGPDDTYPGSAAILAIVGPAGVGKTASAVHWARQVQERFPDGQLYVNLRGHDHERPTIPEYALDEFLRALGVPGEKIPLGLGARAELFRCSRRCCGISSACTDTSPIGLPRTAWALPRPSTWATSRRSLDGEQPRQRVPRAWPLRRGPAALPPRTGP